MIDRKYKKLGLLLFLKSQFTIPLKMSIICNVMTATLEMVLIKVLLLLCYFKGSFCFGGLL